MKLLTAIMLLGVMLASLDAAAARAQQPADSEQHAIRVIARPLDSGAYEFALQTRRADGGSWSRFHLPSSRFLPATPKVGTWYTSSAAVLPMAEALRVRARRAADGRVEFATQIFERGTWGTPQSAAGWWIPPWAAPERWFYTAPIVTSRPTAPCREYCDDGWWNDATQGDVHHLYASGASATQLDSRGISPLMYAALYATDAQIMGVLLEVGADVNASGIDGLTALHVAAEAGRPLFVQSLLWWGADATLRNDRGRTAFERAAHICEPLAALQDAFFAGGTDAERLVQAAGCVGGFGYGDTGARLTAMLHSASPGWFRGERVDAETIPDKTVAAWLAAVAPATGPWPVALHIVYAEQGFWRDGCVGSYPPGARCTRSIPPGWRAIIGDGNGNWHWLHEGAGRTFRWPETKPLVPAFSSAPAQSSSR